MSLFFAGSTYGSPIKPCHCGKPSVAVKVRIIDSKNHPLMTDEYYEKNPDEEVEYYQDAEWEWRCADHDDWKMTGDKN